MKDSDIELLKTLIKNSKIYWQNNDHIRQITSISKRKDIDGFFEPSLCANFSNGDYVALYNCDLSEFVKLQGVKQ